MITLKRAIMSLPEIDGRWHNGEKLHLKKPNDWFGFGPNDTPDLSAYDPSINDIEEYHAAAKSFGWYLSWIEVWSPKTKSVSGYVPVLMSYNQVPKILNKQKAKTPALAIAYAFRAAVECELKEGK